MLVRSAGLAESMSRYLIRRIEETATIVLRPYTEIVAVEGGDHLEFIRWRNNQTGKTEEHKIRHIFVMTGADPNISWLDDCVALDDKGFIKTGLDLSPVNLSAEAGLLRVNHICLKLVCHVFLRWVMYKAAVSSVLRPQWVKDQLQSHLFTKHYRNSNVKINQTIDVMTLVTLNTPWAPKGD